MGSTPESTVLSGGDSVHRPPPPRLPGGTVLWVHATAPAEAAEEDDSEGGRASVDGTPTLRILPPSAEPIRLDWSELQSPAGAEGGIVVRCCHLSRVQQLLVTIRESLAREHAHVLADNGPASTHRTENQPLSFPQLGPVPASSPVPCLPRLPRRSRACLQIASRVVAALFAPLSSPELLALCRRATLVEVPAHLQLLPNNSRRGSTALPLGTVPADITRVITDTTFGLVLSGGVEWSVRVASQPEAGGGSPAAPAASPAASSPAAGATATAQDQAQDAVLPEWLPLAHMGPRETFGELGPELAKLRPSGIRMRAAREGATLLCWPGDALLTEVREAPDATWSST